MHGLTGWLTRRVLRDVRDDVGYRTRLGELEGYVSGAVSVILAAAKVILAYLSGSVSLLADAINNSADIASSLIIALSFRWSRRPRDQQHPYGHGRIETVATLVLAFFLASVALEILRQGLRRLMAPEPIHAPAWLIAATLLTILLKGWLALFARALAKCTGAPALEADFWNHFYDGLSSSLVFLALVSSRIGYPRADGYAALFVATFIGYTTWRYARDAVNEIIGTAPAPEEREIIRQIALTVPGVHDVHDILIHRYGHVRLISLHIEVASELALIEAHRIADQVENAVSRQAGAKVVVHVDPIDRRHPAYDKVQRALQRLAADHDDVVGFHDLRLTGPDHGYDLSVDLVVRHELTPDRYPRFLDETRDRLRSELKDAQCIDLGVEAEYASDPEHRESYPR